MLFSRNRYFQYGKSLACAAVHSSRIETVPVILRLRRHMRRWLAIARYSIILMYGGSLISLCCSLDYNVVRHILRDACASGRTFRVGAPS